MGKTLTTEQFISKARAIHGDKYDYSKVDYIDYVTDVCIICKECGNPFMQSPEVHLKGCGCQYCGQKRTAQAAKVKNRKPIYGIAINDIYDKPTNKDGSYIIWSSMLKRCFDEKYKSKNPTYKDCTICEEWLHYSNFRRWAENTQNGYMAGYQLDKDILVKGNKIYSPETCCFVPKDINTLLIEPKSRRSKYTAGVYKKSRKFVAHLSRYGKIVRVGSFNSLEEALIARKQAKEEYIKEVAQKYYSDGKITKRVYDALMKYEVEITD